MCKNCEIRRAQIVELANQHRNRILKNKLIESTLSNNKLVLDYLVSKEVDQIVIDYVQKSFGFLVEYMDATT